MLKEEKAFLVVMSIAIGTISSSVAIIGRYLLLAHGLLLGLANSLFYPVCIIAMVRFSMALKSWHMERSLRIGLPAAERQREHILSFCFQ